MKRSLYIFCGILLLVYVVLTLLDHSEYRIEKKLWQLQRQYAAIALDPTVVPGKRFDDVALQYQAIIDKYPSASMIPEIRLQVARVYLLKKDFDRVSEILNAFLQRYASDPELSARAMLLLGNVYEVQQDETKALATYHEIIEKYPLTTTGLNVPFYIADYYTRANQADRVGEALDNAATIYRNLLSMRLTAHEQFFVLRYLGLVYTAQQDWESAFNALGMALQVYGGTKDNIPLEIVLQVVKALNTIAISELKDGGRLVALYHNFIKLYPNHKLNRHLKKVVGGVEELKLQPATGQPI